MSSATALIHPQLKKENCGQSFLSRLLGICVRGYGLDDNLFALDGSLSRRWWLWCGASLIVFGVTTGVGAAAERLGSRPWGIVGDLAFLLSCATSSLASLTLFVRFARRRNRAFDSFTANAYGMFFVHYAFVSWVQPVVLRTDLPVFNKGLLVLAVASLLSWGTAALLRRVPLN